MRMDFSTLSASRIEAKQYLHDGGEVGLVNFLGRFGEFQTVHRTSKDAFDALLASADYDVDQLRENLLKANVSFGELACLTNKDLQLMGCADPKERTLLLDIFKQLPKQEKSYQEILKSHDAQLFNETILKRTYNHLDAMRSALAAANYKLKIIPSEDVVVGEKNFASRFVLDALEELKRVTDEIDAQLDALVKEAKLKTSSVGIDRKSVETGDDGASFKVKIFISAALGMWCGYWIWKAIKSK